MEDVANTTVLTNQTIDSLCDSARRFANQPLFIPVLSVGAIIGFLAVGPNLLLFWASLQAKIFPINLRWLLAHLSINMAIYAFALATKFSRLLSSTPRDMVISAYECRARDLSFNIPWHNVIYSLAGISCERVYCSLTYRTYDKPNSKPWLAVVITLAIWSGTMAMSTFQLPLVDQSKMIPVCDSLFSAAGDTYTLRTLFINGSLEVLSVIIILSLLIHDKMKLKSSAINRAQFTLAERFQIGQCVQVHSTVVPTVILHSVAYLPSVLTLLLNTYGVNVAAETRWALSQLTNVYKLIYALANPLLSLRNVHLRKHILNTPLIKMLFRTVKPEGKKSNEVAPGGKKDKHWNVMEDMWVQAEVTRKRDK